jgi:acetoin utilization protein AcuC
MNDLVVVHSPEYANWKFDEKSPTQGRRFVNAYDKLFSYAGHDSSPLSVMPSPASLEDLGRLHQGDYIDRVLIAGMSNEWKGARKDLGELARLMAGGTLTAIEHLVKGTTKTAVNFAGAKHHAQYDQSSGFCVFNDFGIGADILTKDYGMRVAILDIDAHHGDGTENLTRFNPNVLTYSIHEHGIFPGTGLNCEHYNNVYNYPQEVYAGDENLALGVEDFLHVTKEFNPDILFIACGADGHKSDPLSTLKYSINGYQEAMATVRAEFLETPILIGGAGGYQPDTITPEIWALSALACATGVVEDIEEEDGKNWKQSLTQ